MAGQWRLIGGSSPMRQLIEMAACGLSKAKLSTKCKNWACAPSRIERAESGQPTVTDVPIFTFRASE